MAIKVVSTCTHHLQCGREHLRAAAEGANVLQPHNVPGSLGTRAAAPVVASPWLITRPSATGRASCCIRHGYAMFCHRSLAGVGGPNLI